MNLYSLDLIYAVDYICCYVFCKSKYNHLEQGIKIGFNIKSLIVLKFEGMDS